VTTTAGYGHWASPLAPGDVARAKVSLSELCSDGTALYWLESRPAEAGRTVVVRADAQGLADHSPEGVSIRSRVNENGGGALCLVPGGSPGAIAYVDQADQRVWLCDGLVVPKALTAAPPAGDVHNHGGLQATADGDWVLAVREVHDGSARPTRSVVALSTRAAEPCETTLLDGHDFFGAPASHPSGDRLAVVAWDHPDMPWDASALFVLPLERAACAAHDHDALGAAGPARQVAGGPAESVGQPAWRSDGSLRFVSDRSGWWQPYVLAGVPGTTPSSEEASSAGATPMTHAEAEFHGPDWVLGQHTMAELADGTLVARMTAAGQDTVVTVPEVTVPAVTLNVGSAPPAPVVQPCVSISALCAHGDGLALIGSTPDAPSNVWVWTPETGARPMRPQTAGALESRDVSVGQPFTLTGRTGRAVHGRLYRPTLHGTEGPASSAPPLVVWCHGGPTSSSQPGFDPTLQFFTSRGFAVASVDYAGSSGYGRAYRNALWGQWGVADSEDCLDAALDLAARGAVDAGRLAIRGGSAGGMTALNALAAGEGFAACVSWYGVTDLMGLVATTHDFEAHYTDRLIGPLPGARLLYEERSPVHRAASMQGSVLLLQGTEDPVVPPAQAEVMRTALDAVGTHCDLQFFEGEGHGFRRADTLTACLEAELAFYVSQLRL
jgi:dipeptidyl aminopeptidase/acylaminoacyl peptidase